MEAPCGTSQHRVLAAVHGASRELADMEEVENKREVRRIVYSALSIQSNPIISSYISACKHIIMFPHHLMNVCSGFFSLLSACRHFYEFEQTGKRD